MANIPIHTILSTFSYLWGGGEGVGSGTWLESSLGAPTRAGPTNFSDNFWPHQCCWQLLTPPIFLTMFRPPIFLTTFQRYMYPTPRIALSVRVYVMSQFWLHSIKTRTLILKTARQLWFFQKIGGRCSTPFWRYNVHRLKPSMEKCRLAPFRCSDRW